MNWRILRLIATGLICSAVASLIFAADTGPIDFRVFVPQTHYLPFGSWPMVPAYLAIRSPAEWVRFWSVAGRLSLPIQNPGQPIVSHSNVPAPDVDFERFTLLAVYMGPMSSGGYSVLIRSVRKQPPGILVSVVEIVPGPQCAVTSMVTYPNVFALISKTDEPIRFELLTKADCNTPPRTFSDESR